jgi:hypothetical protein
MLQTLEQLIECLSLCYGNTKLYYTSSKMGQKTKWSGRRGHTVESSVPRRCSLAAEASFAENNSFIHPKMK